MNEHSKTRWYRIRPADSWFFRDSRPSNAGEDQSDLHSIFPPNPQTVVGAIRGALAREMGWNPQQRRDWSDDIKQQIGDGFDDVTPLNFTAPILGQQVAEMDASDNDTRARVELLFPAPRHLLGTVETTSERPSFHASAWLRPSQHPFPTDAGEIKLPEYPKTEDDQKRLQTAEGFFVTTSGMQKILAGQRPDSNQLLHQSKLFAIEARIGINRDPEQRSMYSPAHVRLMPEVSLIIGVDGLADDLELPVQFPLGGESRLAFCERLPEAPLLPKSSGGDLLMLLATADLNSEGIWYGAGPGDDARRLDNSLDGTVETCTIDRPIKIGGFDSRSKCSLPLRPHVPAGSVWWLNETCTSVTSLFCVGARTSLGYGWAVFGQRPN